MRMLVYGTYRIIFPVLISTLTCSQQADRVSGLCQEVGVTEHVLFVNGEAQEGEGGVMDVEHKLLLHPHRIQTVISWEDQDAKLVICARNAFASVCLLISFFQL